MLQMIGKYKRAQNQGDGKQVVDEFGNPVFADGHTKPITADRANGYADSHQPDKHQYGMAHGLLGRSRHDEFVGQNRHGRTDGIHNDAFPPEDIGYVVVGPDCAQHRHDHGGAAYGCDGPQKYTDLPGQSQPQTGGQGSDDPGDQHAVGDHVPDHDVKSPDLCKI